MRSLRALALVAGLTATTVPGLADADPAPNAPAAAAPAGGAPAANATPAPQSQTDALVLKVQGFYDKSTSFQSPFAQEFWVKAYNQKKTSRGTVVFQKPGKMQWVYDDPKDNRIVSDGTTLRVYEAANKQMYEQQVDKSQYPAALSFLTGQGKLTDHFDFQMFPGESMNFPGGSVLVGNPKTPTPAYQKVLFYVDNATSQVRRVMILDGQGNRNRFDFLDPKVNQPVKPGAVPLRPAAGHDDRSSVREPRDPREPDLARPRPQRRSLTHVGGPVEMAGDSELADGLAGALTVSSSLSDEESARAHVHGFHAYPARMHPFTAARLVRLVSSPNQVVLDPFCGSGTVVAETMLAGREAAGSDLNPVALELSTVKTHPRSDAELGALIDRAREIAAAGDVRRKTRAGATRRYPAEDVELFDPHVLLELDSIRSGVQALAEDDPSRPALRIALSALLVKVSKKTSDAGGDAGMLGAPKRLAAGYTLKLFVKKTEELAARLQHFTSLLPKDALLPRLTLDDATKLRTVPGGRVDAIVTSPPYAATYDYLSHHAMRARWLDLRTEVFADRELGARPQLPRPHLRRGDRRLGRRARRLLPRRAPRARVAWLDGAGARRLGGPGQAAAGRRRRRPRLRADRLHPARQGVAGASAFSSADRGRLPRRPAAGARSAPRAIDLTDPRVALLSSRHASNRQVAAAHPRRVLHPVVQLRRGQW